MNYWIHMFDFYYHRLIIKSFASFVNFRIVVLIRFDRLCSFQVKIQGSNKEMLAAACEQFLGKREDEIMEIAKETLEGHQRAIMGNMTVEVCC